MTSWSNGYVADVPYLPGYYREQSPSIMALACLLGGILRPPPRPEEAISYLELGCGQGFGALLLAASNPCWRVTAVDFNPAHIATGRAWAEEAGLDNIAFIEADLAAPDDSLRAIPEADFASLHGVWSWVPLAVRAGIVTLLKTKLRPGGAVHLSYNALPGWAGAIGLQRLLREAGRRLAWRSDRQANEGVKLAQALNDAEAVHFRQQPFAQSLLKRLGDVSPRYVAHEYMNESWTPCFHADVASSLASAKLEWVASAQLTENFPELALTDAQRAIYQRFEEPLMRELVKDLCLERTLRHDVFVRGPRRIGAAARDRALRDIWLSLNVPASEIPREVDMPAGRAALTGGFYEPIASALERGPHRVGDLLDLPELEGSRNNPAELIGILVGLGLAEPVLRPGRAIGAGARRFNRLCARLMQEESPTGSIALASEAHGAGVPAGPVDVFIADRLLAGEDETSIETWVRFLPGGAEAEHRERLSGAMRTSASVRMPVLRRAGVL